MSNECPELTGILASGVGVNRLKLYDVQHCISLALKPRILNSC